ncbi:MAG: lysophospholipase [Pseudomonadota bacterium]|nr:lysophospholipase [Pseudomonadota bacterium]
MPLPLLLAALIAASPAERAVTALGPGGLLAGTLVDAGKGSPTVLLIPGSGPTDRDGNSPLGVKAGPYRQLAEALAKEGVSTVRIDKRGMFGSKRAVASANRATMADYAKDTRAWIASIRRETGVKCVWLLGHSEGGLVALTAAQKTTGICGVIAVATVGRKIGTVLRGQLAANPANEPYLAAANSAIASLEAGKRVDTRSLPTPLRKLFAEDVQSLLIDLFAENPARLAASLKVPLLIIQGERDIQVTVADAKALAAAQPRAKLVLLPGVNHVLKIPQGTDRAANLRAYADPSLPIAPAAVNAIAEFVKS